MPPPADAPPAAPDLDAIRDAIDNRPADPAHINSIQPLLTIPETARPAVALLAEWAARPDLPDTLRGLLAFFIAFGLRPDAERFDPAALGVDSEAFDKAVIDPGLSHHLHHAVHGVDLARKLNEGIPLRDAPKFIAAIQKSGSTLLADLLTAMTKLDRGLHVDDPASFRGYPAYWRLGRGHDWDLRADIGADPLFTDQPGAIYKGHIPPTQKNLRILDLYRTSRYLVCVRDPRDQAVAHFCQLLRRDRNHGEMTQPLTEAQTHDRLDAYIGSGTVLESLLFMGKWLDTRNKDGHASRSAVITYEELMTEPTATLRRIADLFELDLDDDALARVWGAISPNTDRRFAIDKTGTDRLIYPLGWTGEIGTHKRYFSTQNAEAFDRVFRGFEASAPWAANLRRHYPDLT